MSAVTKFIPPNPLNTAVLFLVFNRLDTTKQVFEAIRQAKPPRLYVAADGARTNKEGEAEKIQAVRDFIMQNIDWECDVKTLFRDQNLGCKYAVSGAITWFFENEEQGIILEDDTLPSLDFFFVVEDCLNKYKEYKNISSIAGRNELSEIEEFKNEPFLTDKFWCWGWGTWRDRVIDNDVEFGYTYNFKYSGIYSGLFDFCYVRYLVHILRSGKVNTWDWPYDLCFRKKKLKSLVLPANQVYNIGFGPDGTHNTTEVSDEIFLKKLNYPICLPENLKYDQGFVKRFFISNKLKNNKFKYFVFIFVNSSFLGRFLFEIANSIKIKLNYDIN